MTSTQIQCRTNSYSGSSIKALVDVFIQDTGLALNVIKSLSLKVLTLILRVNKMK